MSVNNKSKLQDRVSRKGKKDNLKDKKKTKNHSKVEINNGNHSNSSTFLQLRMTENQ